MANELRDKFPNSWHDEVNEDNIPRAHPGYKLTVCKTCELTFPQSVHNNFILCTKCGYTGG